MKTNERSLRNESCSACSTLRKKTLADVTLVETSQSTKISGRRGRCGRYFSTTGTPPVSSDARIVRRTSTCAWRRCPRCSWPCVASRRLSCATTRCTAARSWIGPPGSARSSSVSGRAGGSLRVRSISAALQLAPQLRLEAPQLLARQRPRGAGRPPAGPAAARRAGRARGGSAARRRRSRRSPRRAAEGGDRQPGEVAHRALGAVLQRGGDLLAQRVEVDLVGAVERPRPRSRRATPPAPRPGGRRSGRRRARTRAGRPATSRASRRAPP